MLLSIDNGALWRRRITCDLFTSPNRFKRLRQFRKSIVSAFRSEATIGAIGPDFGTLSAPISRPAMTGHTFGHGLDDLRTHSVTSQQVQVTSHDENL